MKSFDFSNYYGCLSIGVCVFDVDFERIYTNRSFDILWNIDESNLKQKEDIYVAFTNICRKNQNKDSGTIKVVVNEKTIHFDLYIGNLVQDDQEYLVYQLLPIENREKFILSKERRRLYFGDISIDVLNRLVSFKKKDVDLSVTEFNLFLFLCQNEDRFIAKSELLKEVWGIKSVYSRTVDMHVSRLRKKFLNVGCKLTNLKTIHGRGYLFRVNGPA